MRKLVLAAILAASAMLITGSSAMAQYRGRAPAHPGVRYHPSYPNYNVNPYRYYNPGYRVAPPNHWRYSGNYCPAHIVPNWSSVYFIWYWIDPVTGQYYWWYNYSYRFGY